MNTWSERLYRFILHMFPPAFLARHGDAMLDQFRSQQAALRGRPFTLARFWLRALLDVVGHGLAERREGRRRGRAQLRNARGQAIRDWLSDVRTALRSLRHQPAFTLTAIATLTLGIGANAAVFALAWHTSFRALPYSQPERLITILESNPAQNQPLAEVSPASLNAWVQRAKTLESIGDFGRSRIIFPLDDNGEPARYQSLSPAVFAALGIQPQLGRVPLTDDERQPHEVVISHAYWQRRFGADPGVINRLHHFADVSDDPERIIGVMPPGFKFLDEADIWAIGLGHIHGAIGKKFRSVRQYTPLARVRAGYSVADATAELTGISADLAKEFPDTHAGWTPVVRTLHETVVGKFSVMAALLVSASAVVFLIACTNVAGLLVMRAARRRHEVRLRLALGASRWRIVRLWLFEGLIVASVSLAAGFVIARWLLGVLTAMAPEALPRLGEVAISWPTMLVGALGALGFVAVYAFAPLASGVMRSERGNLSAGAGSRTVAGGGRARGILLGAQASLVAVLLTGTVLLATSLQHLHEQSLGFNPKGVLSIRVSPHYGGNRRPWAEAAEYGRQLEERLKKHPGVVDVGVSTGVPLDEQMEPMLYIAEGDPNERRWAAIEHAASPGYLNALGLSLIEGRWFNDADAFSAEVLNSGAQGDDQAAVISESMARMVWPGQSPLGKRLKLSIGDSQARRVVGVIRDLKYRGPSDVPSPRMFLPWRQRPGAGALAVLIRTSIDPMLLAKDAGAIAREIRPGTGVQGARTLDDLYRASSADTSFAAGLVGGFSVLALLLTGIGVFGAVGYSIATRRRELAVRLALGAGRGHISAAAVSSGFMPVLVGTSAGLVAALGSVRFVRGLLFEVNPLSPTHYVIAGAVLLSVAALASAAPLRRLLTIDPAEALRSE